MTELTALEQAVLDKLLDGDHPVLGALREQARSARLLSRELTGTGFYCVFDPHSVSRCAVDSRDFEIGDVNAKIPGLSHGAGFVLFVRNGLLDLLEGYSYDEPWPEQIREFELRYQTEPRPLNFLADQHTNN